MVDFFQRLFDSEGFNPKGVGSGWTSTLICLDILSQIIMISAFLTIPVSLYFLKANKIDGYIRPQVYKLFFYFSIVCAISRFSSILVYLIPMQRLFILFNYLVAFFVCRLAYELKDSLEYLINLPSISMMREMNKMQTEELKYRKEAQEQLQNEVETLNAVMINLQDILQRELWIYDKKGTLDKLTEMLNQLGKSSDEIPVTPTRPYEL